MRTVPRVSLAREDGSPNVFLVVGDANLPIESPGEFAAFGFRTDKVLQLEAGALAHLREARLRPAPATLPSTSF